MKTLSALRATLFVALLALACWSAGLVVFVRSVSHYAEPVIEAQLPPTEAIVVLTGGSERLTTGVDLLRANKGKKLFVSGVYPGVGTGKILGTSDIPAEIKACCVVLGHAADNTRGNAEETLAFMQIEGFRSLRLVTANYHMPRSLLLFRTMLPQDIEILPYPVVPETVSLGDWWRKPGTASLLIGEYNKYLVTRLRLALGVM